MSTVAAVVSSACLVCEHFLQQGNNRISLLYSLLNSLLTKNSGGENMTVVQTVQFVQFVLEHDNCFNSLYTVALCN